MDILLKTSLDEVIFSGWLYESMNELIKQRYITREYRKKWFISAKDYKSMFKSFVALNNDTPVGILSWFDTIDPYIAYGYIEPSFRKKGMYQELWNHLVNYYVDDDLCSCIKSYTHTNNIKVINFSRKHGREIQIQNDRVYLVFDMEKYRKSIGYKFNNEINNELT